MGEHCSSVKDLINLTDNTDNYSIISGVENHYDLGYYYIHEVGGHDMERLRGLANYIDYESYGRDIALEETGDFISGGYVYDNGNSFTEYYNGSREDIPEEYQVMVSPEEPDRLMFYVAECMEFTSMGEYHENLTLQEAVDAYQAIPDNRLNGIKGIGFQLEDSSIYSGMEHPLVQGNQLDLDSLSLVEHFKESPLVREAVADLMRALPALTVIDSENYLRNTEIQLEDDYGMIDGIINNGERMEEKDQQIEKHSVLGQLSQAKKDCAERKPPAPGKSIKEEPEL